MRIELTDYDPDEVPLLVGLSVVPYVYCKEPATGPHAGDVLRPRRPRTRDRNVSGPGRAPQSVAAPLQVRVGQ